MARDLPTPRTLGPASMFVIVGYIVVVAAVLGGYAMEGGSFRVLLQPIELMIIAGAAAGAFVVGNSTKVLTATVKALPKLLQSSKYTKTRLPVADGLAVRHPDQGPQGRDDGDRDRRR